jgi:hypothetical protein
VRIPAHRLLERIERLLGHIHTGHLQARVECLKESVPELRLLPHFDQLLWDMTILINLQWNDWQPTAVHNVCHDFSPCCHGTEQQGGRWGGRFAVLRRKRVKFPVRFAKNRPALIRNELAEGLYRSTSSVNEAVLWNRLCVLVDYSFLSDLWSLPGKVGDRPPFGHRVTRDARFERFHHRFAFPWKFAAEYGTLAASTRLRQEETASRIAWLGIVRFSANLPLCRQRRLFGPFLPNRL